MGPTKNRECFEGILVFEHEEKSFYGSIKASLMFQFHLQRDDSP